MKIILDEDLFTFKWNSYLDKFALSFFLISLILCGAIVGLVAGDNEDVRTSQAIKNHMSYSRLESNPIFRQFTGIGI